MATNSFRSIEQLAAAASVPVQKAEKNIVELFNKGYFENAYFDSELNSIVFTQEVTSSENNSSSAQQDESPAEHVPVTCNSCGAKNKFQKGTVGECVYCGNYLSQE